LKRTCLFLWFLMVLLLFGSTAYAAGAVCELKELNMKVTIPQGWYTITRDTPKDDSVFTELGVDGGMLLEHMNQNKIYLNAVLKSPLSEIIVTKIENDDIKSIYDLNSLSESKLKQLTDSLMQSEDAKRAGITYTGYTLYSHPQAKFIVLDLTQSISGATVYGRQYLTVINECMINITMHSYEGMMTDDQKNLIQSVVHDVAFTQVNKKPGFQLNRNIILKALLRGALVAGGVTLVLTLIRNVKGRKSKKTQQ